MILHNFIWNWPLCPPPPEISADFPGSRPNHGLRVFYVCFCLPYRSRRKPRCLPPWRSRETHSWTTVDTSLQLFSEQNLWRFFPYHNSKFEGWMWASLQHVPHRPVATGCKVRQQMSLQWGSKYWTPNNQRHPISSLHWIIFSLKLLLLVY